ncbi:hypothetical protein CDD80_942 [Ophiocordyceps camponoti-rufipedis]|uniref:Uncharacterized protein n=1 Tax=Ophiocordyceps camponoti-rufipedis TaxID=2004952 RepID=A0A2C5YH66_9HYPO|nr:hypothetical protein CDD80_942 [Ophiocordyceps camponoti-rufipedis]
MLRSRQVTSLNLPTQYESNLLTPISATGSPPLQQIRKLMGAGQYPQPPGSPQAQEPTPPGSSSMYHHWNQQFDINGQPSSTSSPIGTPAHVGPEMYTMMDDRRTPAPPEPYLGGFGVSDPDPQQMAASQGPPYFIMGDMNHAHPLMMRGDGPSSIDAQHRATLHSNTSMLASHPPTVRPPIRRTSPDALGMRSGRPAMELHPTAESPRRRPASGSSRIKKSKTPRRQSATFRGHVQSDPAEEHKNCNGEEVPPTLKSTCPDEERCIFDSRWHHRHQRGQDMWDSIQSDFTKRFNKTHGKEMLQMKFKRARSKYIEWLPKDEAILIDAWKRMERERYQTLLDLFLDMKGSRNMRLSASDIEVKVVNDMKLEEHLYMDNYKDLDIRRRRKVPAKKRHNGPHDDNGADDMLVPDGRMTHNEDEVVEQVHARRELRWETDSSAHSEVVDLPVWDNRAPMKMEAAPSTLRLMTGPPTRSFYGPQSK